MKAATMHLYKHRMTYFVDFYGQIERMLPPQSLSDTKTQDTSNWRR